MKLMACILLIMAIFGSVFGLAIAIVTNDPVAFYLHGLIAGTSLIALIFSAIMFNRKK